MRVIPGMWWGGALLAACAGQSRAAWHDPSPSEERVDELVERASFDLDCPADQLETRQLGNEDTLGAKGCGRRATYVYDENHKRWLLNSVVEDRNSRATTPADNADVSQRSHGSSGGTTTP
jgi:hypothetical protein